MSLSSRLFKPAPAGRIPDGWRVYAIGDIHGRADLLDLLLARIEADLAKGGAPQVLCIFLGDYIDRGRASKAVIESLIQLGTHRHLVCLKGNHEAFLMEFFTDPDSLQEWKRHGALDTLMSYGLRPPAKPIAAQCTKIASDLLMAMPKPHVDFFQNLALSFSFGDYFFVHAGVRPNVALAQQREKDLLWIREDFLLHERRFEKIIVHGHTPVREPEVFPNRINIDTGAYATGRLTCLVIEGQEKRFI
jgi:serine/threonine protein phosphatase 1